MDIHDPEHSLTRQPLKAFPLAPTMLLKIKQEVVHDDPADALAFARSILDPADALAFCHQCERLSKHPNADQRLCWLTECPSRALGTGP